MEENIEFEIGSGNVFADIGFENSEEMLLKSELVRQINSTIKEQALSSIRFREILNLDEKKLAALLLALQQGENSGLAEYSLSGLLEELDREQSI
jgi:predicted XRE-type DNA-binding protein